MEIGHTIKCMTMGMPALLFGGQPGCRAGDERLAYEKFQVPESLQITSPSFLMGGEIPKFYAQEGNNLSPGISCTGIPLEAVSLALIVEDPDAPTPNPYLHWLVFNLSPEMAGLSEGAGSSIHDGGRDSHDGPGTPGKNSTLHVGYVGAAPPKGDRPHRYFFQLFALDTLLDLPGGAGRGAVLEQMSGRVIARGKKSTR